MVIYISIEVAFGLSVYIWIKQITKITPFGFDKATVKSILKFAVPMALASLISSINTEADKIIVGGFVDTDTLAIYTNSAKELPVFIFSTSISSVVMPFVVKKVANKDFINAVKLWRKSMILSYYLICFSVVVLFVFAPQVISILYSEKYLPGVNVFRIYSCVLLFRITYYGMILNALGKTKMILKASIVTMLSNLILDLILYKVMGLLGPAFATLISVGVMNLYQLHLTKNITGVTFSDIYPIKDMLRITTINICFGGIFYIIQQLLFRFTSANELVLAVFLGMVWLLVYGITIRKKLLSIWHDLNKGD